MPGASRLLAAFALAASLPLVAAAPATPPRTLELRFVTLEGAPGSATAGDAWVDLGALSAGANRERVITVRRRVGLRLEGSAASARVSVSLAADIPGCIVKVDGRRIQSVPQMIDPAHRVGATVAHEIEFTIPAHVPPGPLLGNLLWVAEHD